MDKLNIRVLESWGFRILVGAAIALYARRKQLALPSEGSFPYYSVGVGLALISLETPFNFLSMITLQISEFCFMKFDSSTKNWAFRCLSIANSYNMVREHLWKFGGTVFTHVNN